MHRRTARLTFTLLLLVGCGKPGSDPESASTTEATDSSGTIGHSSAPTGETPTGETPTGETPGGLTAATTSGATTLVETSDFGSSDVPEPTVCALMCQHAEGCQLRENPIACASMCETNLAVAAPECAAAAEAMLMCLAGLTCEQLALALDGQLGHPCDSEQIARDTACAGSPDSCDTGGGGNLDGSSCEVASLCLGDPLHEMKCDTQQCLCFEDGAQVGSCPADGACTALDTLGAKALSCCGFAGVGP